MRRFGWLLAIGLAVALPGSLQAQATGTIRGTVTEMTDGTTPNRPIAGAQVFIVGTQIGARTDEMGRFTLTGVPIGQQTVRATMLNHIPADRTVTVAAGQTSEVNIRLQSQAIALEEFVVTGVSGATARAKVPFSIAKIDSDDIQINTVSAASAIQGKVAGASVVSGSGRPGSAPSVLLRGPKSIDASGRDQDPLYIVDGVILSSGLVDIDAMDIQSIEVVKGAAGASLYGSRAANGVIQITTKRGANIADDEVRYTFRTEYGNSSLPETPDALLAEFHHYRTNDQGLFVTTGDKTCTWIGCIGLGAPARAAQGAAAGEGATDWNTFNVEPWPGRTYDQVDRFFQDGVFNQNYIGAEGRSGATNFHVSFSNLYDEGVVPGLEGFKRNNFRLNLDQAVRDNFMVSASAFYSRSESDHIPNNRTNPLLNLSRTPAGIDLYACEPDSPTEMATVSCRNNLQEMILKIDPGDDQMTNPVYEALASDYTEDRGRFLGSATLRYSPLTWFDIDANASYDRLESNNDYLWPKQYRTPDNDARYEEGRLWRFLLQEEAFNASATGTFRFDLAENVRNRTQVRYLYEEQTLQWTENSGHEFRVQDIHQLGNLNQENVTGDSEIIPVRSDGYFLITNFDISDRYIVDALVRNDGSSLFGEDERRQWYYRLAGAWRLSEEPWFTAPGLDEFKLRYAYGTAGGRPRFEAQYETFAITTAGPVPVTLGNEELKPEFSREQEAGVDMSLFDQRIVLGVTYANTVTEDQILLRPLPSYTGYTAQWQNVGTLESNTWEASLDARLYERGRFAWNGRVIFDRTRTEITELDVPPFQYGVGDNTTFREGGSQELAAVFFAREGEEIGTFYGARAATSCDDIPTTVAAGCDQFRVNDEGLLVWTGGTDLSANQWGTPAGFAVNGQAISWGTPMQAQCDNPTTGDLTFICPVGNTLPDYSFAVSSNMSWGGLSLYGLIESVQGFDVYNQPLQWNTFAYRSGLYDQADVPEAQRKPIGYFFSLYQNLGGLLPSSYFVEDASFTKLRELAVRYRIGADRFAGIPGLNTFSGATLSLIGRNLLTWSDYRGFDPEVGFGSDRQGGTASSSEAGSAAVGRIDGFQYPQFRTWTLGVELNF